MMIWKAVQSLCAVLLLALPVTSYASVSSAVHESERNRVALAPERTAALPGETLRLGLVFRHPGEWHTYWLNPGDSGAPTTVSWDTPGDLPVSELRHPYPEQHADGPIITFVHKHDYALIAEVDVPADARPGQQLTFRADAQWLVCDDICVPEEAQLSVTVPVAKTAELNGDYGQIIQTSRQNLPREAGWQAAAGLSDDNALRLHVRAPEIAAIEAATFFPLEDGLSPAGSEQILDIDGERLNLSMPAGYKVTGDDPPARVQGVLVVEDGSGDKRAFTLDAPFDATRTASSAALAGSSAATPTAPSGNQAGAGGITAVFGVLGAAFLGGLILNLMPCVFPVLSMKAMSLAHLSGAEQSEARTHSLVYSLGCVATFAVLGLAMLGLRAGGAEIGWGFHLQQPAVLAGFALLMLAVGLNLSGVFEIGTSLQGAGSNLANKGGLTGAFFTGVLAVAVAAPCIGPFMGPVIGLTFTQGPAMAFAVFFTLGAGLAAPFLLMAAFPRLARVMPRPGAWMKTFKEVMAFLMYFAAAGVLWALTVQAGTGALAAALFGGLVLAAALYVFGKAQTARGDMGRRLGFGGAAVTAALALFITVGGTLSPGLVAADDAATTASAASGEALSDLAPKGFDHRENWSEARIDTLQAEGKAVFVDFTASWCVTCLANKRVALNRDATRDFFNERDITFMTADWSRRDERIAKALESYGRAGVPLYVYYPSHGGQARILPQVLTVDTVLDAIKAAEAEGAAQSARRPNSPTSDEGA